MRYRREWMHSRRYLISAVILKDYIFFSTIAVRQGE